MYKITKDEQRVSCRLFHFIPNLDRFFCRTTIKVNVSVGWLKWIKRNMTKNTKSKKTKAADRKLQVSSRSTQPKWKVLNWNVENDYREGTGAGWGGHGAAGQEAESRVCVSDQPELCESVTV